jgi:hypothetical protein
MNDSLEAKSTLAPPGRADPRPTTGVWPALREAILGTQQDFTEGSIVRSPMIPQLKPLESVNFVDPIYFSIDRNVGFSAQ